MMQVYETSDLDYIKELIHQYPKTPTYVDEMESWVTQNLLRAYTVLLNGKPAGSLWICKVDRPTDTWYNLEGYRDITFPNPKDAFTAYYEAAKIVLSETKERPLYANHFKGERYAKLVIKRLGFKHIETNEKGILIYEYSN